MPVAHQHNIDISIQVTFSDIQGAATHQTAHWNTFTPSMPITPAFAGSANEIISTICTTAHQQPFQDDKSTATQQTIVDVPAPSAIANSHNLIPAKTKVRAAHLERELCNAKNLFGGSVSKLRRPKRESIQARYVKHHHANEKATQNRRHPRRLQEHDIGHRRAAQSRRAKIPQP